MCRKMHWSKCPSHIIIHEDGSPKASYVSEYFVIGALDCKMHLIEVHSMSKMLVKFCVTYQRDDKIKYICKLQ